MPVFQCHITDCPFSADAADAVAAVQTAHHLQLEHPAPAHAAGATPRKGPPITRPMVELGISEDNWDTGGELFQLFDYILSITSNCRPSTSRTMSSYGISWRYKLVIYFHQKEFRRIEWHCLLLLSYASFYFCWPIIPLVIIKSVIHCDLFKYLRIH